MSLSDRVYRSAAETAWLFARALGVGDSKLARAVRDRLSAADRLTAWAERARDPARPLVWMHAPSVGEGLQARAVLAALAARRRDLQVVFTYFSPSAEGLAARMPADYAGPLPWDTAAEVGRAVAAVQPTAVVFTKTEVWPVLAATARARGARTALVAASLHAGSSRRGWPARALLRETLAALDLCAAITTEDAERFALAGLPPGALRVTGDPGVDSAVARVRAADPAAPHLKPFPQDRRPTLVAGSTWATDEAHLLGACTYSMVDGPWQLHFPELRVVIAPHEPARVDARMIALVSSTFDGRFARLAKVETRGTVAGVDAVIVDRLGVLAQLYTIADIAWVGGGFHRAGVHSVIEPAAAGLPMLFGPRCDNAWAAGPLVGIGAAQVVRDHVEAKRRIGDWLADPDARRSAGAAGRRYIEGHMGAAERTAELVSQLLPATSAR